MSMCESENDVSEYHKLNQIICMWKYNLYVIDMKKFSKSFKLSLN